MTCTNFILTRQPRARPSLSPNILHSQLLLLLLFLLLFASSSSSSCSGPALSQRKERMKERRSFSWQFASHNSASFSSSPLLPLLLHLPTILRPSYFFLISKTFCFLQADFSFPFRGRKVCIKEKHSLGRRRRGGRRRGLFFFFVVVVAS